MTVVFKNPGEIDLEALLLMGESIKTSENPIGRFGTGFKYAVATLLRSGAEIVLWRGTTAYSIREEKCFIRGKETGKIMLGDTPMHISINLGKDWEVWQAYRELWSNCKDEKGYVEDYISTPKEGLTQLVVHSDMFDEVHRQRSEFLISERKDVKFVSLPSSPSGSFVCQAIEGVSNRVFYRGIAVGKFKRPTLFTYNLGGCDLSEDRTMKYEFQAKAMIAAAILSAGYEDSQVQMLTASRDYEEAHLTQDDFERAYEYIRHTHEGLMDRLRPVVDRIMGGALGSNLGDGFGKWYAKHTKTTMIYEPVELSDIEAAALEEGRRLAIEIEPGIKTMPVTVVSNLGGGVLGMAKDGRCYLARQALVMGDTMIAGTLFEEWAHIVMYYNDESRDFQNFLLNKIATMAKTMRSFKPVPQYHPIGYDPKEAAKEIAREWFEPKSCYAHLKPIETDVDLISVLPVHHNPRSS